VLVLGSNVSECSPITTDYIWRARDRGARLVVVDPRLTPIARTADLYLPVKPGRDSALLNAILHTVIRLGGLDREFIAAHTTGFEAVERMVADYAPETVAELVGIPAARIVEAATLWTQAPRTMLLHARGIEHHTKGVLHAGGVRGPRLGAGAAVVLDLGGFCTWYLLGPLGTFIADDLHLSATSKGLLVATPLLGGSLFRIVLGVLADHLVRARPASSASPSRSCRCCWAGSSPIPSRRCWG
jgi:Molybdopterin oxidoreductase